MKLNKQKYVVIILIALILVLLVLIVIHKNYYQKFLFEAGQTKGAGTDLQAKNVKPNRLAIGNLAKAGPFTVDIAPPVELDFKTKTEILDLRKKAVQRFPQLMASEYEPAVSVFGQISDKASWWGIKGQYFCDQGPKSIEGDSEESRFILNPFLLVAADFLGLSIWKHGDLVWDKKRITEKHLNQPDFPFYCKPESLQWWPGKASAEVGYNVSKYIKDVNKWVVKPLSIKNALFDLVAYNAHDWGFNYIFLSLKKSVNVSQVNPPADAVLNNQFIHLGGSSKYPGGSNNMSPFVAGISEFYIDKQPASAVIFLWYQKPETVESKPDMTFVIKFY